MSEKKSSKKNKISHKNNNNKSKNKNHKLSDMKQKLLDLYYNKDIICDHLWIEGDLYYTDADEQKIVDIRNDLELFSKNNNPALIVHIDSTGGDPLAGKLLYNLLREFNQYKPIITVVEFTCMSAATYPFLAGNLRIFKPYCLFLIHQTRYSYDKDYTVKFKALRRDLYSYQLAYNAEIEFFKQHTTFPDDVIRDHYRSEKFLLYDDALKYNVVHHIFDPKRIKKLKFKSNDELISKELYITVFLGIIKFFTDPEFLRTKKINKLIIYTDFQRRGLIGSLKYVNLILEIPIEIEFIIPTSISNGTFLMSLFANKSYIIQTMSSINLYPPTFEGDGGPESSMEDTFARTNVFRHMLSSIFKEKTNLPPIILREMFFKYFTFKPDEYLKYGLVDEIIDLENNPKVIQFGAAKYPLSLYQS